MGYRNLNRLSKRFVETVAAEGLYHDGGRLYLEVRGASKSWTFRYTVKGRQRAMGLGPLHTIDLEAARDKARRCRQQRLMGIDPFEARANERQAKRDEESKQIMFEAFVADWIKWKNHTPKTKQRAWFAIRVFLPKLGELPINKIDSPQCAAALEDTWVKKPRNGRMARDFLEVIFERAIALGLRSDNPATMTRLEPHLPQVHYEPRQYRNLPHTMVGKFIARLRQPSKKGTGRSLTSYAAEFIILTAVRKEEALGICWPEIDWDNKLWTCPAERTKKSRRQKKKYPHEVPLNKPALAILRTLKAEQEASGGLRKFVFTHSPAATNKYAKRLRERSQSKHLQSLLRHGGKSLGASALVEYIALLRQELMPKGFPYFVLHAFRTSFKNWSIEKLYDERLSEMTLHHTIGNVVRNKYVNPEEARLIVQRARMLEAWGNYCNQIEPLSTEHEVVPFRNAKSKGG